MLDEVRCCEVFCIVVWAFVLWFVVMLYILRLNGSQVVPYQVGIYLVLFSPPNRENEAVFFDFMQFLIFSDCGLVV